MIQVIIGAAAMHGSGAGIIVWIVLLLHNMVSIGAVNSVSPIHWPKAHTLCWGTTLF